MKWLSRKLEFAKVVKSAPPIHGFRIDSFNKTESVIFSPGPQDKAHLAHPYSDDFTSGDGSKESPFTYLSAASVSPHYCIVDLWLKFRLERGPIFIEINDYIFRLDPEGVTAEDGTFTKLLPDS